MFNSKKLTKNLLISLLCGIGINFMLITIILQNTNLLKFWKDIIIVCVFLEVLIIKIFTKNANYKSIALKDVFLNFFLLCLFFSVLVTTEKISTGIYMARIYLMPLMVYFIAKNSNKLDKENVESIFKFIFIFYTILAIWGIFQAEILGHTFLINLGYPIKYSGRLINSFYFGGFGNMQRVVSTFSNANIYACVIGFIIILATYNKDLFLKGKKYSFNYLILITAFLLTFSRSNWIAMLIILIMLMLNKKKVFKNIIIIIILIVIILGLVNLILKINIFEIINNYIKDTIMLEDPSAKGRFAIWKEAFIAFSENPLGIGMGNVGKRSLFLSGEVILSVESSYLAILLDTGIQGAITYFMFIILAFYSLKKRFRKEEDIYIKWYLKACQSICIYLFIIFIFSNHIYDWEIMIFFYFFIGLAFNNTFINSIKQ